MESTGDDPNVSSPAENGTYDDVDMGDSEPVEVENGSPTGGPLPTSRKSRIESLEIELGAPSQQDESVGDARRLVSAPSEDDEEDGDEAVSLLAKSDSKSEAQTEGTQDDDVTDSNASSWCKICEPELRMGNISVPSLYVYGYTGGWGAVGPHFMGPPCLIGLVSVSTYYFAVQCSLRRHWYWTFAICLLLGMQTLYFLLNAAYRDPGVVREGRLNLPTPVPRSYRWCESCNYYQPPTTMHCPSCEACIAGFDHHCVWMGTCVGVGNFKPFMRFNLSWIGYLLYAILWVSIIAPLTERNH